MTTRTAWHGDRQAVDQRDLRVFQLFAGGAEAGSDLAQQLHLELVYEYLEQGHFGITGLHDKQQRINGVGRVGGVRRALYDAIGPARS